MDIRGTYRGDHAVVIGGSMGGLLAARVLSDHFGRVTILEKDPVQDRPESRKGQPQTRHLHALLAGGCNVLTTLYPTIADDLRAGGAIIGDIGERMRWFAYGGYRRRIIFGSEGVLSSRPYLEWHVRRLTLALPNVTVRDQTVVNRLLTSDDRRRVTGLSVTPAGADSSETIMADLVVDASGRGSGSPRWLETMGYERPVESEVKVRVGYATRLYERDPDAPDAQDWIFVTPTAPAERRMGGAFPIEGNRWTVSLGGWHGDHPPTDEEGFEAFAASLPAPDVHQIVRSSRPLSGIVQHKFPSSLRRHYEKLTRFPEGFLVMGDAICSFNPLYGQGMTSAALQAMELAKVLQRPGPQLSSQFFRAASEVISIPWQTAVGEDFRYPETEGVKAKGTDFINSYVARVHRATHRDVEVCRAFLKVTNLTAPPTSLFHPDILARVLRPSWLGRPVPAMEPGAEVQPAVS